MTVLPGHGAKIWEFTSKRAGRDLLYHHNRVRRPAAGLRPERRQLVDGWHRRGRADRPPLRGRRRGTALPGGVLVPGLAVPDRGIAGPDGARVHVWAEGIITPLRLDRWLELRPGEPVLRGRHRRHQRRVRARRLHLGHPPRVRHPAGRPRPGARCRGRVLGGSPGPQGGPGARPIPGPTSRWRTAGSST